MALGAAAISVAGLAATLWVKSPAQLAAEHGPPSPSILTAPVAEQVLTATVVVRGTVVAGSPLSVTPTGAQGASSLVITRTPKHPGDAVTPGSVLVEVSGRPVIALRGALPAYRDLRPGDTGADVAQLQAALKALGYADSDKPGKFGAGTKKAVSALYQHLGYTPPTTGGPGGTGDAAALQAAAQRVTTAQRAATAAAQAVTQAQADLAAAKATTPPDPAAVAHAETALGQAKQNSAYAQQDLADAKKARSDLIATTGVEMPLNEFVFVPSFPARISTLRGGVGAPVVAPLLTLDSGALVVESVLQQPDQTLVKANMAVGLTAEQLNQEATGTVAAVGPYRAAADPGADAATAPSLPSGYPLTVTAHPPLPAAWLGQDVRVTIEVEKTSGPVLVVPVAAVSTGQDGVTSVTVLGDSGERHRVTVTAGLESAGTIQVTPSGGAQLRAGDEVIIG